MGTVQVLIGPLGEEIPAWVPGLGLWPGPTGGLYWYEETSRDVNHRRGEGPYASRWRARRADTGPTLVCLGCRYAHLDRCTGYSTVLARRQLLPWSSFGRVTLGNFRRRGSRHPREHPGCRRTSQEVVRVGLRDTPKSWLSRICRNCGRDIIIPLMVDRYLLDGWEDGQAADLRSRVAADFTGWEQDDANFEEQFERVVLALRTDEAARAQAPKMKL